MKNYTVFKNNNKIGLKDSNGNIIFKPVYDYIDDHCIKYNIVVLMFNDKWGLLDLKGNQLLPIKYKLSEDLIKLHKKKLKIKKKLLRFSKWS